MKTSATLVSTFLSLVVLAAAGASVTGCDSGIDPSGRRSVGIGETVRAGGPRVVWDILAEPLPEIPLPNDAATRLDPTSPTGRRLNISIAAAHTHYEQEVRGRFNELDGFGTYAPIFVSFDAPLNVADLAARHGSNDDFRDDAVFLLNVDTNCARFGEEVALDIGRRRFPVSLYGHTSRIPDPEAPSGYRVNEDDNYVFEFDPYGEYNNIMFEETYEDANDNGVLDEGEDRDMDGVLDVPNFIDTRACLGMPADTVEYDRCVIDNLMTFYDRASNTLILRPVWPLEQQCTYAVVLSKRLLGANGAAIESPFPGVNPRDQTRDLAAVDGLLSRYGLGGSDVAFAWTFTTGTQTRDLEALRAGLYGSGVFAFLADEFPVGNFFPIDLYALAAERTEDQPFEPGQQYIPGACAGGAITSFWDAAQGEFDPNMCALETEYTTMGAFFAGSFTAPNLLADTDGVATPAYQDDVDERFQLDYRTGEISYGSTDVTFICGLPVESNTDCSPGNPEGMGGCKPFPVILYAHGYGSNHGELLSHMGRHASMGYASCALDSYGHGYNRARQDPAIGNQLQLAGLIIADWGAQVLVDLTTFGRDRDLNNDGLADPGQDQWTADLFHTRDMVRQSALEYMQFVRMLRAMDGITRDAAGNLLGDIDKDGVIDMGGRDNSLSMWGISLGGIIGGVLAGIEHSLDAVSPNAGGAGLTDVSVRLGEGGLPEAVLLPMMGPVIAGCVPIDEHQNPLTEGEGTESCLMGGDNALGPFPAGQLQLAFFGHDLAQFQSVEFAQVGGVGPGDRIVYTNIDKGESVEARVNERGWFRVGIAADALEPNERRALLGMTDESTEPVAYANTPELGDRLMVEVFDGETGTLIARVDTFGFEEAFQGTLYQPGMPLVALQEGLGYQRNTPEFRRFIGIAQTAIGSADPGVWASHYFLDPLDSSYDPNAAIRRTRVLVMPTVGDNNVPVSTGVALARTSGLLGSWVRDESISAEFGWRELFVPDPRYGRSVERELEARFVVEGDHRFERFPDVDFNREVLYDIDNVSDGTASFSCGPSDWSATNRENGCAEDVLGQEVFFDVPNPEPGNELRVNRPRGDGTFDAFRVPMLRPIGQHGIYNAQPFREFDADAFMVNFTSRFLGTRGRAVDHPAGCDCSAAALPAFSLNGRSQSPGIRRPCTENDMNLCSPECAEAWGFNHQPAEAACMVTFN
jgi:hypothetical protein